MSSRLLRQHDANLTWHQQKKGHSRGWARSHPRSCSTLSYDCPKSNEFCIVIIGNAILQAHSVDTPRPPQNRAVIWRCAPEQIILVEPSDRLLGAQEISRRDRNNLILQQSHYCMEFLQTPSAPKEQHTTGASVAHRRRQNTKHGTRVMSSKWCFSSATSNILGAS